MDILNQIIIPLGTFILGILFTLLLEKFKRRRSIVSKYVPETAKLINDWYNQLYEIGVEMKNGKSSEQISNLRHLVSFYEQNRLILPKLILNLEILKKHKSCSALVDDVETFLAKVTNNPDNIKVVVAAPERKDDWGVELYGVRSWEYFACTGIPSFVKIPNRNHFDTFLRELDHILQKINRDAGAVLA